MAAKPHEHGYNTSAKPINFGSYINISIPEINECLISSEGFINSKLYVKRFDLKNAMGNFMSTTFKVMPFTSSTNFKTQIEYYDLIENYLEIKKEYSKKDIKERKTLVNDLKNNFDTELNINIMAYHKMKGTPIILNVSSFQLIHVLTMKYLALNITNKDNIYFELIDQPNEHTFLKFLPSLKMQKQRNNIIYDQDVVYICTANTIIANRVTTLYMSYNGNHIEKKREDNRVIATLEDRIRPWRINLYQYEITQQESLILKVGDAIWLALSETNDYLSVKLNKDAFKNYKLYNDQFYAYKHNKDIISSDTKFPFKSKHQSIKPIPVEVEYESVYEEDIIEELRCDKRFINTTMEEAYGNNNNDLFDNLLWKNVQVIFRDKRSHNENKRDIDMTTKGLWRIESKDLHEGGLLEWNKAYRLRHLASRRYLKIKKMENGNILTLSKEMDDDGLFYFISPIKRFNSRDQSNQNIYITKENFIRIQHVRTKEWIRLMQNTTTDNIFDQINPDTKTILINKGGYKPLDKMKFQTKVAELSKENSAFDIFKIKKATFEDIWETSFLMSTIPVLSDLTICLKPIKIVSITDCMIKNHYVVTMMEKTNNVFAFMEDFIYNRLASNIATNQEYGEISQDRQRILREQCILGLLCSLLMKEFPTAAELTIQSNIIPLPYALYLDNEIIMKRLQTDLANLKYKIMNSIYKIISLSCIKNKDNQEYVFKYIENIIRHIGNGDFIQETLISILKNNEKLLYKLNMDDIPQSGNNNNSSDDIKVDQSDNSNVFDCHSHEYLQTYEEKQDQQQEQQQKQQDQHQEQQQQKQQQQNVIMDLLGERLITKLSLLDKMLYKIKGINIHDNPNVLLLLKDMCICNNQVIYINQEKIFKHIYSDNIENKTTDLLLNFINQKGEIYILAHNIINTHHNKHDNLNSIGNTNGAKDHDNLMQSLDFMSYGLNSGDNDACINHDNSENYTNVESILDASNNKDANNNNNTCNQNIRRGIEFVEFIKLYENDKKINDIDNEKTKRLLMNQLELYSALCKNRNYNCSKVLNRIFTLDTLIKYILNDTIADDIRSILISLMTNLHIDKYPNTKLQLPSLIKFIFAQDNIANNGNSQNITMDTKLTRNNNNTHNTPHAPLFSLKDMQKMNFNFKNKEKLLYDHLPDLPSMPCTPNYKRICEKNWASEYLEENQQEYNMLNPKNNYIRYDGYEQLRNFISKYLTDTEAKITKKMNSQIVYNSLTLEVIRLSGNMLKFGLFFGLNDVTDSQLTENLLFKSFIQGRKSQNSFIGLNKQNGINLELLIRSLARLLEYDDLYFHSMKELNIDFKFESNKNQSNEVKNAFKDIKDLRRGFRRIGKFFNVKAIDDNNEKNSTLKKKSAMLIDDIDVMNFEEQYDPIFLKQKALKKILNHFDEKSYLIREHNVIENQIKIEICDIFNYILDMRADFLIENVIQYFKDNILISKTDQNEETDADYHTLLPDNILTISSKLYANSNTKDVLSQKSSLGLSLGTKESFNKGIELSSPRARRSPNKRRSSIAKVLLNKKSTSITKGFFGGSSKSNSSNNSNNNSNYDTKEFKNYTSFEEVKSLDDILGKSFFETALMSLYSAKDSDLQNSILKLLYRVCNERYKLIEDICTLEILSKESHFELYTNMVKLTTELKNLESTSQIWLQIIDKTFHEQIYFSNINKAISNLTSLEQLFSSSEDKQNILRLIQMLFNYMNGHMIIIDLLKTGLFIFDKYYDYFNCNTYRCNSLGNTNKNQELINTNINFINSPSKKHNRFNKNITHSIHTSATNIRTTTTSNTYHHTINTHRNIQSMSNIKKKYNEKIGISGISTATPYISTSALASSIDLQEKIMKIFEKCYSVLALFCKNNVINQRFIANHLNLIVQYRDYDLGQIELIQSLFNNHPKIAIQKYSVICQYLRDMIHQHGKISKFLDVMLIMIRYEKYDNTILQKSIMDKLLNNKYFEDFSV